MATLKRQLHAESPIKSQPGLPWFDALFGLFLGLALLKFGNPFNLDKYFEWPTNIYEWLLNAWPVAVGRGLLLVIGVLGFWRFKGISRVPKLLLLLPAAWLMWQMLSLTQSVAQGQSMDAVIHFFFGVLCFYLGLFCLDRSGKRFVFFGCMLPGFAIALLYALEQHFGGLEASKKYWMVYVYPTLTLIPPEYMKRMTSTRVFGTLFYPNSLAGVVLLLLPVMLGIIWSAQRAFTKGARVFLMAILGAAALASLFWSGSKGGWLMFLMQGVVFILLQPIGRKLKVAIIVSVLVFGLAGFTIKYMGFFRKGATSVVARFDYWHAAVATALDQPLFGNGPGTFDKAYTLRKRPESEMARLAHNDYLQQASDSGIPGFLLFTSFVVWGMIRGYRAIAFHGDGGWVRLSVWIGLLGWAVQSFVEFGLYIPAIGWLAFALMGWLLAQPANAVDKPAVGR